MEFQVVSVVLEDRYPPSVPRGKTREDLLQAGFHEERGPPVLKQVDGRVAFVFGRAATGDNGGADSVCVRVEGIRPRLYYALAAGDTLQALQRELEREVRAQLRDAAGIKLERRTFAHLYGYEPDASTPSGRAVHDYAEAYYPSLQSWRAACRLRRRKDDDGNPFQPDPSLREAHEAFVDPVTRFNVEAGVVPGAWVRVPVRPVEVRVSTCDVEYAVDVGDFAAVPERSLHTRFTELYYDLETLALDPEADKVIQASMVFVKGDAVDKHLVALGTVAPLPGATVHACRTEAELLRTVRALVARFDPDFVVAYNARALTQRLHSPLCSRARSSHCTVFRALSLSLSVCVWGGVHTGTTGSTSTTASWPCGPPPGARRARASRSSSTSRASRCASVRCARPR